MLTDEKLREIRESVDLVALVSEYVPLRRQGARFVGLCPFHQEKTPSFGVSRGKDFFYCFGCHESGDAISFLRKVEGLAFMEAVEKLAERAGIEVPKSDDPGQIALRRARARRERLAELMGLAQRFYEEQLASHPHAALARDELARRKVRDEVAKTFHLGYAPAGWDALARHLASQRVDLEEAVELGLIAPRSQGGGHYDRFRHRLMFPVADHHGRIIAFSGRALPPPADTPPERETPAKYINSPEGPLYKKGQALFGLATARVAMRKHDRAIVCEGNFDLVAIFQAGFEHVLAPLGTAFTLDQARLIRRFAEEVVVVFDGDSAGRKATAAAHELLTAAGLRGRAVRLPDGHDPDSFLSAHGADAFAQLVANAPPILDFLIDEANTWATDAPSRSRAIQRLAPYVASLESTERAHYERLIASKLLLRSDGLVFERHLADVRAELRRGLAQRALAAGGSRSGAEARGSAREQNPENRREPGPQTGLQTSEEHKEGDRATSTPIAPVRMRKTHELPERQRIVLGALLDHPALCSSPEGQRLAGLLTDSDLRAIFVVTAQMLERRGEVDALALLDELSCNGARAWLGERLSAAPCVDRERAERLLAEGVPLLERDQKNEQRAQLKREIQLANQSGDSARAAQLTRLRDELART